VSGRTGKLGLLDELFEDSSLSGREGTENDDSG
jgi:hypothetical protein